MFNKDLSQYGITGATEIIYNPSYECLFEEENKPELTGYDKGQLTELDAMNVMTGIYTGRSPKDKYIVMDKNSKDTVWWTTDGYKNDNHPLSEENWAKLKKLAPDVKDLEGWAAKYTQEPEKVLPKADLLESAAAYREKKAKSVVKKMGIVMRSLYAKLKDLTRKYESLSDMYDRAVYELEDLRERFRRLRQENDQLCGAERDLRRVRGILG